MDKKPIQSVYYLTVESEFSGQRIDNFLINHIKGVPRSLIYRILRKGEVRVNKKRAQPSYRVQEDDNIRIPPIKIEALKAPVKPSNNLMDLLQERILYEDKALLIINKPSGIAVHGGSGVQLGLVEALRTMYPKSPHLELAHRLDADTSGCLVLAKKRSVLKELHELLRQGKVTKIYLTLTMGHWKKTELRVEAPLQKNQISSGERMVKVHPEGKLSLTVFNPIKTYKQATLLEAALHTGRTHQIRVHSQYRGHPIAGDEKYGNKEFNKTMRQFGLKRLFLHAHFLEFTLPSTGQTIKITAPLEPDLEFCLHALTEV